MFVPKVVGFVPRAEVLPLFPGKETWILIIFWIAITMKFFGIPWVLQEEKQHLIVRSGILCQVAEPQLAKKQNWVARHEPPQIPRQVLKAKAFRASTTSNRRWPWRPESQCTYSATRRTTQQRLNHPCIAEIG